MIGKGKKGGKRVGGREGVFHVTICRAHDFMLGRFFFVDYFVFTMVVQM